MKKHNCYPSHGSVVVVDWVDWTIFEKGEVKKKMMEKLLATDTC